MFDTAGFPELNTGDSLKQQESSGEDSGNSGGGVGRVNTTEGNDIFDGEIWNHSDVIELQQ